MSGRLKRQTSTVLAYAQETAQQTGDMLGDAVNDAAVGALGLDLQIGGSARLLLAAPKPTFCLETALWALNLSGLACECCCCCCCFYVRSFVRSFVRVLR